MNRLSTQTRLDFDATPPLIVADGMGVDSTAMLEGMRQRGIRPDAILFADTGAEKPKTYAYLPVRQEWLRAVGFPSLTIVKYAASNFKNWPAYHTIDENCFTNGTLPSIAFGFQRKSCSIKWKIAPQEKWTKAWQPAVDCWSAGGRVRKAIGYDASPSDSRRYAHAEGHTDESYEYDYFLRDWGWDRAACIEAIDRAGLPIPVKSACFMCPASKPPELSELPRNQLRAIVVMEARATPRLTHILGLWGVGCKGVRKPEAKKPGRMTDYIRSEGLLPAGEIDFLWNEVPRHLIRFQEGFAAGEHRDELSKFLELLDHPGDLPNLRYA
jgi:hypothetical protein